MRKWAWTALISVVAMLMVPHAFGSDMPIRDSARPALVQLGNSLHQSAIIVAVAEPGDPTDVKAVQISDFAPNVETDEFLGILQGHNVLLVEDAVLRPIHRSSGRDYVLPVELIFNDWKVAALAIGINGVIDEPRDFAGWQVSNVTHFNMSNAFGVERENAARTDRYIGPLEDAGFGGLSLGSVAGVLRESNRRLDQPSGYENQQEREAAYEKPLVAVHKSNDRSRNTSPPASEVWGVFGMFGYLCLPILAVLMGWGWLLKAWGVSVAGLCLIALGSLV